MGNLDGWGGPLPLSWHAKTLALQQKILTRMRSFGMIPVLPGFAGHVPKALVHRVFPHAKYTNSSVWVGFGDQYRTVLLDPLDPLFKVWNYVVPLSTLNTRRFNTNVILTLFVMSSF